MISKKALKRYIDSQIRLYFDINLLESKMVRANKSIIANYMTDTTKYAMNVGSRLRRRELLDKVHLAVRVNEMLEKIHQDLLHGDNERAEFHIRQLVPKAWELEITEGNVKLFEATEFVKNLFAILHQL